LAEIELLRQEHLVGNASTANTQHTVVEPEASNSFETDSTVNAALRFCQRVHGHRKHKSFITMAKWIAYDARKFDSKFKELKNLVTNLDTVSQAAGLPPLQIILGCIPASSDDSPPPYSAVARSQTVGNEGVCPEAEQNSPSPFDSLPAFSNLQLYDVLTRYIAPNFCNFGFLETELRELVDSLPDEHFNLLCTDTHDEILRRGPSMEVVSSHLVFNRPLDPRRIEGRRMMSMLLDDQLLHLAFGIAMKLASGSPLRFNQPPREPRIPHRRGINSYPKNRRWGFVGTPENLSALKATGELRFSQGVQPSNHLLDPDATLTLVPAIQCSSLSDFLVDGATGVKINVSPLAIVSVWIEAALKNIGVSAHPGEYDLYLECGTHARRLGQEEIPLQILTSLHAEGQNAAFTLRKAA
jgi:hypothetical protein